MPDNNLSECARVRALLGPDPGPTKSGDAYDHLEHCLECRGFYAQQKSLAERLRALASAQKPPAHLRTTVLAALDREAEVIPSRKVRRFAPWPVIGGLVAAAAAVSIWIGAPPGDDDNLGPAFAAAVRSAPTSDAMETNQSQPLQEWFQAHRIPVFDIPVIADARLTGGRVIQLDGYQSAAVDFVKDGVQLTYVMAPVSEWQERMSSDDIIAVTSDGFEVALWQEDGTTRALLSPMPRRQLLDIAEQCKYKRTL